MRRGAIGLLLVTVLSGCGSRPNAGNAAVVANDTITQASLSAYVRYALSFYAWAYGSDIGGAGRQCGPASRDAHCSRVRSQALLRLMEERIVLHYASAHNIRLSPAEKATARQHADALLAQDTTASQLLSEHRINRAFIVTLLQHEALVTKVERAVVGPRARRGKALHLRRFLVPFLLNVPKHKVYQGAVDLATEGRPIPEGTSVRTEWVARFRLATRLKRALIGVVAGQFVGPFPTGSGYLVVQLLGRGVHRLGRPARTALETRLFRAWLARQMAASRPHCFDPNGHEQPCPSVA